MSGIFKGDSIYKSGGGGGGYKDGGELVDGDFIKAENNAVSSYDNVSRDPLNFYFEVKDGEVLNSVIELTTAVNATVNVYIFKNGFYYPLGNSGGNTVNAGDHYNINIMGNSFILEQVTPSTIEIEYAKIDGDVYKCLVLNNIVWMCEDLRQSRYYSIENGGINYYMQRENFDINGWRLPKASEFTALNNAYSLQALRSSDEWPEEYKGDNSSGFNLKPNGYFYGGVQGKGTGSYLWGIYSNNIRGPFRSMSGTNFAAWTAFNGWYYTVRLVYDI